MAAAEAIRVLPLSLAGKTLVEAGTDVTITRSVPHGHVAAVWAMAQHLGLPALLGPAGRVRDLVLARSWRWSSPGSWRRPRNWPLDPTIWEIATARESHRTLTGHDGREVTLHDVVVRAARRR